MVMIKEYYKTINRSYQRTIFKSGSPFYLACLTENKTRTQEPSTEQEMPRMQNIAHLIKKSSTPEILEAPLFSN